MNNLQQQIQDAEARRQSAQQNIDSRAQQQRQAEADARVVQESNAQLARLQRTQARAEFEARKAQYAPLLAQHDVLVAQLHTTLNARDLDGAALVFAKVEDSFNAQQAFKQNAVALLAPEFQAAADAVRSDTTWGDMNIQEMRAAARMARAAALSQFPNAIYPHSALYGHIASKPRGSIERQVAQGLIYALVGGVIVEPSSDFNMKADSDTRISSARLNI